MSRNRTVDVSHIDTCLACYLDDHHNRAGEYLVGVPVDDKTTVRQVRNELESELLGGDYDAPAWLTDARILRAIRAELPWKGQGKPIDSSLETDDDNDDGDGPQAWFLLSWSDDNVEL